MAATTSEPHTIVQSWVPVDVAQELKASARAQGCSLSSLVRAAIEATLHQTSPIGEGAAGGGSSSSSFEGTRRGAGASEGVD